MPFAQTLIEAAPDRVLWGTDWPHPNISKDMPNDGELVDLLFRLCPDAALREKLLVTIRHGSTASDGRKSGNARQYSSCQQEWRPLRKRGTGPPLRLPPKSGDDNDVSARPPFPFGSGIMNESAVMTPRLHQREKPFYRKLYVHVFVAIILGVLLGHFAPSLAVKMKPLGDAFIKLIKMVIGPIIFCTVVTGMAGHGRHEEGRSRRRQGAALFRSGVDLSLVIGLVAGHLLRPG